MRKKLLLVKRLLRLPWEEILFMIKLMRIFCLSVMILDLIMFFTHGSILHLFLAGALFACFYYWMNR